MIPILGKLLWWMVENWAQLLVIIGLIIMLQWLKKIAEQLSYILIELRDIDKDTGHMLRVINEEIERNTEVMGSVHSAVTGVDHTLSGSLQVLYRIEDKLSAAPPPYLTPTGDRL
jgi:hypothetical protein